MYKVFVDFVSGTSQNFCREKIFLEDKVLVLGDDQEVPSGAGESGNCIMIPLSSVNIFRIERVEEQE
jgi:hypothetical protein